MSAEKQINIPKWKALILASRPPFLQVTIAPIIMGILIAWLHIGSIDIVLAVLTLLVGCLFHLSVNLAHEYYDWKSGTDNININAIRPFTGGSGMIQLGAITPLEELIFGLSLMILGVIIGIYILLQVLKVALTLLFIGGIAVFSILFYTTPPIKLSYRGVGEFFVFLNFGPLMALGAYVVLAQRIHLEPLIIGVLLGLFTASILIINEFPDAEADAKAGKKHLVVRLGVKKARYLYALTMLLPYALAAIFIALQVLPMSVLLTFLLLPYSIKKIKWCFKHYASPRELFPANIGTILNHLLYSILLIISYVLAYFLP